MPAARITHKEASSITSFRSRFAKGWAGGLYQTKADVMIVRSARATWVIDRPATHRAHRYKAAASRGGARIAVKTSDIIHIIIHIPPALRTSFPRSAKQITYMVVKVVDPRYRS